MPQRCAGQRMLPPVSEPIPSKHAPHPIRAPSPDEEPPGEKLVLRGCNVLPNNGLLLSKLQNIKIHSGVI